MFQGHKNGFKNGLVMLSWALAVVSTGTGFYLVHTENNTLSSTDQGYLIAAATMAAVALFFLTLIGSDYLVDMVNFSEYHLHGMVLAWALLVASMGIWWWVYNTRLVNRDNQYLLTSAITATIAVALLTSSVFIERGMEIPVISHIERAANRGERSVHRVVKAVTPGRGKSPKRSPKKSSPKRK